MNGFDVGNWSGRTTDETLRTIAPGYELEKVARGGATTFTELLPNSWTVFWLS